MIRVDFEHEGGDQLDLLTKPEIKALTAWLPLTSTEGDATTAGELIPIIDGVEMYDDQHTVWGLIRMEETSI